MKTPSEELSGLELREAVAREVMGWRLARLIPGGLWWFDGKRPVASVDDPEHDGPPAYESSIEAAFALVEKMREKGYEMMLSNGNGPTWVWDCEMMPHDGDENKPCSLGQANEPARAICLAALDIVRAAK